MESIFDEPLFLCDVKSAHFGLSEHGRVKVLDSDAVFPKSVVGKCRATLVVEEKLTFFGLGTQ